jgi:signal transduction histidine kinase
MSTEEHQRQPSQAEGTWSGWKSGELAEGSSAFPIGPPDDAVLRCDEVAQIVHDLKSPLSTIALELALLDGSVCALDPEVSQLALARVARNVQYLDRMVQDLLDLCALEGGQFSIHRRPTELGTLLDQVIDRVVATRDRERVRLQVGGPIVLAIDDLRIERVVENLVHNAFAHASPCAGVVVRLDRNPEHAVVSVIDAGPGIDPSRHASIFEKYRSGTLGGRGLGLYVARRIVEAHGGRIGVESIPGAGSRFFFELPTS